MRKWLLANGHAEAQYVQTAVELGTHFGVTYKTIQTWAHKGMPGPGEQGYDVAAVTEWCEAMGLGPGRRVGEDKTDETRADAERRKAVAMAEKIEMEVRQRKGELVDAGEKNREYTHHATHARALLEQTPDRFVGTLPPIGHTLTGDDIRRIRREAKKAADAVIHALFQGLKGRAEGAAEPKEEDR